MAGLPLLGRVPFEVWVAALAVLLLAALTRYIVRAVVSGNLVPKATVDEVRADRDGWRAKSEVDSETIRTVVDQNADMLAALRDIQEVLTRPTTGTRSR